jgi:hypothetical protein
MIGTSGGLVPLPFRRPGDGAGIWVVVGRVGRRRGGDVEDLEIDERALNVNRRRIGQRHGKTHLHVCHKGIALLHPHPCDHPRAHPRCTAT